MQYIGAWTGINPWIYSVSPPIPLSSCLATVLYPDEYQAYLQAFDKYMSFCPLLYGEVIILVPWLSTHRFFMLVNCEKHP
jgi:hypothetical protein